MTTVGAKGFKTSTIARLQIYGLHTTKPSLRRMLCRREFSLPMKKCIRRRHQIFTICSYVFVGFWRSSFKLMSNQPTVHRTMVKLLIHGWNPGLKTTLRKVMSLVVRLY